MPPEPLLEVIDLEVVYRPRRRLPAFQALYSVSLTIAAGETLGIVGESGSGKSSLGKAVLGLEPTAGGQISFDGHDITHAGRAAHRSLSKQMQVVFQDPYSSFNPSRTIGQSVAETLVRQPDLDGGQVRRRVGDMLERVGIERSAMSRYPSQFSGGQRQRIAIARALLPRPRLVICDEPVSALDLSVQAQVLNLLADLRDELGVAYLFISHDMGVVRHICDRAVVLQRGRVVETGSVTDVYEHPQHPYTQTLIAAAPVADPVRQAARREHRRLGTSLPV